MNPFAYARVNSPSAAVTALLHEPNARFIAGGTNLLDLMKDTVERPSLLVDINALPLKAIEWRNGSLWIGALARMSDVAAHAEVRSAFPAIALALEQSASPQLRNMASMGGNILQRTRCPYFRDVATPCNKRDPGSGCGAIGGVNRMQAVLGTSGDCIATHASDVAVAFAAFDAVVHAGSARGNRDVPFHAFYRLPGSTPNVENALERGELVTGISVPALDFVKRSTYLKVRDRSQYDFPLASAAVALEIENERIRNARVALGGIATIPWRSPEAEAALIGAPATRATFQRAAEAALAVARGYGQNDFKILLAQRTLVRALTMVAA